MAFKEEIFIPTVSTQEATSIFDCVLLDNPVFFHVSSYAFSVDSDNFTNLIQPDYNTTKSVAIQYLEKISQYLMKFDAAKSMDDLNKELYVHDFCLNYVEYDYKFNESSHSVIGPVFYNTAVCEGIAKFVKIIFDYIGIKSLIVSGKTKHPTTGLTENHAWNIVEINGDFCHLDVTFDMTLTDKQNRYDYFNLPDKDIIDIFGK